MTKFEKILVVVTIMAMILGIFEIGFQIGKEITNSQYKKQAAIATAQRDRLADYIRIYEDMQADGFDACDSTDYFLHDFIDKIEHEDNMYADMPPMNIDDWCYAY